MWSVEIQAMFRKNMSPPPSGSKNKAKQESSFKQAYSSNLKLMAPCSSQCLLTFNRLHGVISQMTEAFRYMIFHMSGGTQDSKGENHGTWGFQVRFEVFTAVTMKNAVFWDVAPCRSCVNLKI
jgi:hypothetical protein